jgi:hypothetical protein
MLTLLIVEPLPRHMRAELFDSHRTEGTRQEAINGCTIAATGTGPPRLDVTSNQVSRNVATIGVLELRSSP